MGQADDLGAVAKAIIGSGLYMVLGTADGTGRPWAAPVYYATAGYRTFYWVSAPEAKHSSNIAERPEISLVIFNSGTPIGTGQGVYMSATVDMPAGDELARALDLFSRRSRSHGAGAWTPDDVRPPAAYRLYRATVSAHWVLQPGAHPDQRTSVVLDDSDEGAGDALDRRG